MVQLSKTMSFLFPVHFYPVILGAQSSLEIKYEESESIPVFHGLLKHG
jgi:hypothetical protein